MQAYDYALFKERGLGAPGRRSPLIYRRPSASGTVNYCHRGHAPCSFSDSAGTWDLSGKSIAALC